MPSKGDPVLVLSSELFPVIKEKINVCIFYLSLNRKVHILVSTH
jgi:hypothetical protein